MSKDTYINVFGKEPINNTFIVNNNNADPEEIKEKISGIKGFTSVSELEKDYAMIKTIQIAVWGIAALITFIYTFLVCAGALRKVKYLKLNDMA